MNNFKNKVVIITGGASGIGKITATQFAQAGAIVVIADIDSHKGELVCGELNSQGYSAMFVHADVSTAHGASALIAETEKAHTKIDILVNNAGIEISGPMVDFSEDDFDKLIAVNFKSAFLCSKYALKGMMSRRAGVIINLASVASFLAWPDDTIYSATKAAILLMTKGLAIECAPYSIRVNAVAPGIIDTPMTDRALHAYPDKEKIKVEKGKLHPIGRLGKPEEVARAILFLSCESSTFITGVALPVDGGYLAG